MDVKRMSLASVSLDGGENVMQNEKRINPGDKLDYYR